MKVYLVGAGPGDEGLITVKGLRLLKAADVVVYDYLSEFGLLRHVKPGTKLICVGKSPGRHSASQAEINAMLIAEARAAKSPGVVIVRLKGGDPFVFGRGGEEVDALREAGIDFEVVPGVSSAWAAPAYAGIPLTHREFSSSVAIVTGHQAAERKDLNLQALAQTVDTLVLLMGMANIDHICSQLLAGGLDPQTPAAVIERGSCAGQRKLVSDLGNIVQKSLEAGLSAPAVIVIGKVAQLGNFSNWFEQKPLAGRRIAVTRARHQAGDLVLPLQELGADVLEFSVLAVKPVPDAAPVMRAIDKLSEYDWIVFTSANGAEQFFSFLHEAGKDARALGGVKIAVIGPGTAKALSRFGLVPDFTALEYIAESLASGLIERIDQSVGAMKVLIPRASRTRDVLEEMLGKSGCKVEVLPVYETVLPQSDDLFAAQRDYLLKALEEGSLDAITFASASAVDNFFSIIPVSLVQEQAQICLACIGPVTGGALKKYGLTCTVQPENHTIESLYRELSRFFSINQEI